MYQAYWQFQAKPFETGVDPQFYFPSESHQGAILKLRYAVESRRGGTLLAGPSGSGKTLLVAMLREILGPAYAPFVHLVFPQMTTEDLLEYLSLEMTGRTEPRPAPVAETIHDLQRFLTDNAAGDRHAVLVVDEAHLIDDPRTWEALRLLLNFEHNGRPVLTLLVVGQTGLLPIIERVPQLEERLGVKCLLRPFTAAETSQYVQHRLAVAGSRRTLLNADALEAVQQLTLGIPRRINRLVDLALLIGYAEGLTTLTAEHLRAVNSELVTVTAE
jgi:type II secretory pathway predicted ATPase ExeA